MNENCLKAPKNILGALLVERSLFSFSTVICKYGKNIFTQGITKSYFLFFCYIRGDDDYAYEADTRVWNVEYS